MQCAAVALTESSHDQEQACVPPSAAQHHMGNPRNAHVSYCLFLRAKRPRAVFSIIRKIWWVGRMRIQRTCSQGLVLCNLSISYLQEAGSTIHMAKANIVANITIIHDQELPYCGRFDDRTMTSNVSAIHVLAATISSTEKSATCGTTNRAGLLGRHIPPTSMVS